MNRLFGLLALSGALINIGCGEDRARTILGGSPISVRVIDAETKAFICDASVLVADGAGHSKQLIVYRDESKKSCSYAMEDEYSIDLGYGAGVVGITVARSGYRTAMRMIQMVQDECGLIEQTVQFESNKPSNLSWC